MLQWGRLAESKSPAIAKRALLGAYQLSRNLHMLGLVSDLHDCRFPEAVSDLRKEHLETRQTLHKASPRSSDAAHFEPPHAPCPFLVICSPVIRSASRNNKRSRYWNSQAKWFVRSFPVVALLAPPLAPSVDQMQEHVLSLEHEVLRGEQIQHSGSSNEPTPYQTSTTT